LLLYKPTDATIDLVELVYIDLGYFVTQLWSPMFID